MIIKKPSTLIIDFDSDVDAHAIPFLANLIGQELMLYGRNVTILSKENKNETSKIEGIIYVRGEYTNYSIINELLDKNDEVINLSYCAERIEACTISTNELINNITKYTRLFHEISVRKIKLILISSGGMVYGVPNLIPIPETHNTKPTTEYGISKLMLEQFAYLYFYKMGMQYMCVRPSNVYGPGQRPFCGQGFIPTAIASALEGKPVKIYGKNGTIRDYIYINDYAKGIAKILIYGKIGETYNLGSGVGKSTLEVCQEIQYLAKSIDKDLKIEILQQQDADIKINILDTVKLFNLTKFIPNTEFRDGMLTTFHWLRQYLS